MKKSSFLFIFLLSPLLCRADAGASASSSPASSSATIRLSTATVEESTAAVREIHAIHLTASAAGSKRYRQKRLDPLLAQSVVNAVVVDVKEEDGFVYVPGVAMATEAGAYENAIPDLAEWLADLKKRGVYTVARIVVFKDNILPRKRPALGVHTVSGDLWQDRKQKSWLDPYNRLAWRYPLLIALQSAKMGFDEVQFDYFRFPTDGNLKQMRFSKPYSRTEASRTLIQFLEQAEQLLHPLGTKISIDVFGLTTSVNTGMGIGQLLGPMAAHVDFVCPMTYPSHYNKGEYGIPNPNDEPYRTIHLAMHDALKVLGPAQAQKLRPYLQDFSLKGRGIRYGPKQVTAQIQAAADVGVMSWTLWNASCHYTLSALQTPVVPAVAASTATSPVSTPAPASSSTVISQNKH